MTTLEAPTTTPLFSDTSSQTHIVNCPQDKSSSEAWLTEATVFGLEVTALCGYTWVPTKDPLKHTICQPCIDAAGIILADVSR